MIINSPEEMVEFASVFAKELSAPTVIELIGDVGAGKTTFVTGLAKGLGVSETVTSPSYVLSKRYELPDGGELIHYDFYRLNDPGIMENEIGEALSEPKNIVVVEWGESVAAVLPKDRTMVEILMVDEKKRDIRIEGK